MLAILLTHGGVPVGTSPRLPRHGWVLIWPRVRLSTNRSTFGVTTLAQKGATNIVSRDVSQSFEPLQ